LFVSEFTEITFTYWGTLYIYEVCKTVFINFSVLQMHQNIWSAVFSCGLWWIPSCKSTRHNSPVIPLCSASWSVGILFVWNKGILLHCSSFHHHFMVLLAMGDVVHISDRNKNPQQQLPDLEYSV